MCRGLKGLSKARAWGQLQMGRNCFYCVLWFWSWWTTASCWMGVTQLMDGLMRKWIHFIRNWWMKMMLVVCPTVALPPTSQIIRESFESPLMPQRGVKLMLSVSYVLWNEWFALFVHLMCVYHKRFRDWMRFLPTTYTQMWSRIKDTLTWGKGVGHQNTNLTFRGQPALSHLLRFRNIFASSSTPKPSPAEYWPCLNVFECDVDSIRLNCRRYHFYFLNVFEPEFFSFDLPDQTIRKQFILLSLQSLCLYLERLAKRQICSCCVWQLDVIVHLPL